MSIGDHRHPDVAEPRAGVASAWRHGSARGARGELAGWVAVLLVTLAVLATWAPSLTAALGDNHEGRILARHALNVANAQQDGLRESGWLSDWSPYVGDGGEQTSYAHHPPLLNLVYYGAARVSPLALDTTMRATSYLLGVAMLPLGAAALRRRGLSWAATLAATIAVAVTPLFWVYGRIHGNVALLLAMTLMVVRVAEHRPIPRRELALAAAVSVAAIVAGYLGMAMGALLGLWLLRRRGVDRVTVTLGVTMVVAALISVGYVIGSTGLSRVGSQLEMRTTGGGFTAGEFVERIATWARALLPWWWRWLVLPVSLVAGLWDRRTRPLTVMGLIVTLVYVVGLPNGSFIHDYWILPILLPVWFGAAAAVEGLARRTGRAGTTATAATTGAGMAPRTVPVRSAVATGAGVAPRTDPVRSAVATAAALALLLVVAGAAHGLRAGVPGEYLTTPQAAGELARTHAPSDDQDVAWRTGGLAAPRWLSFYWDLPPALLSEDDATTLGSRELVLVRITAAPGWLGEAAAIEEAAREVRRGYAVLDGAAVQRLRTAA